MHSHTLFTEVYESDLARHIRNPSAGFALAMWSFARGKADIPARADFERALPKHLRDSLMVLKRLPDDDFSYEHYGAEIARQAGFDMTGRKVSEFNGPLKAFYAGLYRRVVTERRPLGSIHRLGHFRERPMWERIMLPVGDEAGVEAIYAVNTVREIDNDVSMLKTQGRAAGVIALQFERGRDGAVSDAIIVGVNRRAQEMTGRRLDELLDRPIRACFPGVMTTGLWDRYVAVAERREAQRLTLPYDQDRVSGVFDVTIAPFHDGVTVEFSAAA